MDSTNRFGLTDDHDHDQHARSWQIQTRMTTNNSDWLKDHVFFAWALVQCGAAEKKYLYE